MPKLRFHLDPPLEVPLSGAPLSIGRSRENDIQLNDTSISRRHALIEPRGDDYWVVDCGSTNGIEVSGKAVKEARLVPGRRMRLGRVVAHLDLNDDATVVREASEQLNRTRKLLGGRYTVEAQLGEGSQADVFRARRLCDGALMALKVFRGTVVKGSSAAKCFANEVRALRKLSHYAIVAIHDAGVLEGTPFLALDYLSGGALDSMLRGQGVLSIDRVIALATDVAAALAYAHANAVIHRDIKPANVMFDAKERAVVTDFGIAKLIDETGLSGSGALAGTPLYMSPEQFAGHGATVKSDLYSFGATLYRCLTGRAPIEGTTIAELAAKVRDEQVFPEPVARVRPDTPASLAEVVGACLQKDPDQRPTTADEVVRALA